MFLLALPDPGSGNDVARAGRTAAFPDLDGHWAEQTVAWAVSAGIVTGYEDGTFRPDKPVSEPEFLAMLVRAFPEAGQPPAAGSGSWYAGYDEIAAARGWTVAGAAAGGRFNRGDAARLIASTQGERLSVDEAVQYLLDRGLTGGKTSATVAGYRAQDALTRAEAAQFIRNLQAQGLRLDGRPAADRSAAEPAPPAKATHDTQVRGIAVGDPAADVLARLGQPARKDISLYGFEWYVYNADMANYTLVGIRSGRVVGLYTTGDDWTAAGGKARPGMTRREVEDKLGKPETAILKGNTYFQLGDTQTSAVYLLDGNYVTFYYDRHEKDVIAGFKVIERETELALQSFYGEPGDRLRESYEREAFELANAARAQRGLDPFAWNDGLARVAREHSADMAKRDYFAHVNPDGEQPWDRAKETGLTFRAFAENIAAGQPDAIAAHHAWMNSEGHRANLLGTFDELGVGVAFGGEYEVYYTQNFRSVGSDNKR